MAIEDADRLLGLADPQRDLRIVSRNGVQRE